MEPKTNGCVKVNFDAIGQSLTAQVKPGPRSSESRSNKYSFFSEIDDVAMRTYSPAQIATILQQREDADRSAQLQHVLASEVRSKTVRRRPLTYLPSSSSSSSTQLPLPPGFAAPDQRKRAWVPDDSFECQFKCCHACRPTCEPRSYLSLDGVADGDIPPSAAAGFGFHHCGIRPIGDANVVKNIGYRPVPLPRSVLCTSGSPRSSLWSMLNVIDEQIVELARVEDAATSKNVATKEFNNEITRPAKASSEISHLHDSSSHTRDNDIAERQNCFIRACATPLPTPTQQEETFFRETLTQMEEQEIEEGRFHKTPLEVADGIAVLEESVEMHVPDVMTQF
ncbi:hypothetical protein PFICI_05811 [Pestalotiopsis fici W106-1]|uniref:Uncharacterized protein n=1 Tax=Pestalotiopsis fici (strain W106-1 / CGMCC3.15140) TaxID=1229662 RepID=W3XCZ8_PESFW|nr:uncharacterized protein PFICI_05811 [Pestalotiopsis fici W106-1]ETS83935.1 hypothetical protein PFICI_05811 [Pestalotiopsis fici W106-1]